MSNCDQHLGTVAAITRGLTLVAVAIATHSVWAGRPSTPGRTENAPKPPPLPTLLIVLDAETSGAGFQDLLDKLGQELKVRIAEAGLPAPDLFKVDSPSTRRALAEKAVVDSDFARLNEPVVVMRLSRGLARRFALLVRVNKIQGVASELTLIDTRCLLLDNATELQESIAVQAESFELAADDRGRKPSLLALAARRLALKIKDHIQQMPTITAESALQRASERAARAEKRLANGEVVAALDDLAQALALAPREARLYRLLGDCYASQGDYANAVTQYRRSLSLQDDAAVHLLLARLLVKQNDLLAAGNAAKSSIQLGDDSAEARKIIAQALLTRRDALASTRPEEARKALEEAAKHLQRAVTLEPNDLDLVERAAEVLLQSGQYSDAATLWSRLVRARPNDLQAREAYAGALFQAKKYDEALNQYLSVWPQRPQPLRLDAEAYRRAAYLIDRRTVTTFSSTKTVLEDLESGKVGREQALGRFQSIRKTATEMSATLELLSPPSAASAMHSHRRLAYTFFDQALVSYLTFLDTDDTLFRDRGMVLQTQAATEYNVARGRRDS